MTKTVSLHTPFDVPLPRKTSQRLSWGRLHGGSVALAIANALAEYDGLSVIIAPDMLTAQKLSEELRFFAGSDCQPLSFPDWETLPYDMFSPHQDIISERLGTLYHLPLTERGVLILPITTFMQKLAPSDYVQLNSLVLAKGEQLNREAFCQRLELSGYRNVTQVMEHGEYSVRGSLLDLFPMGSPWPYRIDLFDNEVDSIRYFDPETQRSKDKVDDIHLLPAREFPLTDEAIQQFREHWHARFDNQRGPAYDEICKGMATPGAEYYIPLFFEHTSTYLITCLNTV
ncbi:MAG: hypothetical protein AAF512_25165 [Pseudomonadota bacterium]